MAARITHDGEWDAESACKEVVELLEPGTTWLAELVHEGTAKERLIMALEVVATAMEHDSVASGATAIATELAVRLECERVSLGVSRRRRIHLEGLSHSGEFDDRSDLIRDLEAAMDEAADQDATITYPPLDPPRGGGRPLIAIAHQSLVKGHGNGVAWTVPLGRAGRVVGALSFERPSGESLDESTLELCEDVGTLVGPVIDMARRAEESWFEKVREFTATQLRNLFGPGHPHLRLAVIGCSALFLSLCFARAEYRVTADATLEGRVQRAIVAGIDGYVAEANFRAGDLVKKGQALGRLDDRDLILERRSWLGRRDQLLKEHRNAFAQHDRSQVNILSAQVDQANAQLGLLDAKLSRTRFVAPFDGIVVKGDLSQSLGSPVARGDVLFEIAPLDGYRIILKVDQRDIADPAPGQRGQLALSALPGVTLPLIVKRITPVSIAEDGRNYFRVEAHLDQQTEGLRPGMEGVAKIAIDRRRLIWIWTHSLTDWLRLWTWSWLP